MFEYYSEERKSRYFKVLLSGEIAKCGKYDNNVAATEITILEEMTAYEIINIAEWWKSDNVLDLLYFSEGFAQIINCERKYNHIDKDGKILSEEWFYWADYFHDGFARVQRFDDLMNLINKEGKIILNEWFRYVDYFQEGLAVVRRADDKYNYIEKDGKILSEEWFNYGFDFKDGLALVERINGESCKIDKNGKIVVSK